METVVIRSESWIKRVLVKRFERINRVGLLIQNHRESPEYCKLTLSISYSFIKYIYIFYNVQIFLFLSSHQFINSCCLILKVTDYFLSKGSSLFVNTSSFPQGDIAFAYKATSLWSIVVWFHINARHRFQLGIVCWRT